MSRRSGASKTPRTPASPNSTTVTDLDALLARVPGWQGRAHVVRPLEGGITNRNFLIAAGDERFVLRVAGPQTQLLEIDRRREYEAAARAAAIGIAPQVIAWIEPEGYLVTRFLDARPLTPADLASPPRLRSVVEALRAFHRSGPLSGDFDAFSVPFLHRDVAAARGVAIPREFDRAASCAEEIAAAFSAARERPVAAHNDLLTANFLADAERVWLIDWEYAGNNDRYFDLANLAVNNSFDSAAEEQLLAAYFGSVGPRQRARLALMKIMSDFREAMWGVVQQAISTIEFDYGSYASEHFDRLLGNAAAPEYGAHLEAAANER